MREKCCSNPQDPIDLQSVLERIGGDEEFLQELIDLYREDFLDKTDDIQKAIEKEQFGLIQELGHSLKGSSGNLSLGSLQEISYDLEISGREKSIDLARKSLERLKQAFKDLENFLSQ
jgi:two-component system sensor histidine kinase/response regulator